MFSSLSNILNIFYNNCPYTFSHIQCLLKLCKILRREIRIQRLNLLRPFSHCHCQNDYSYDELRERCNSQLVSTTSRRIRNYDIRVFKYLHIYICMKYLYILYTRAHNKRKYSSCCYFPSQHFTFMLLLLFFFIYFFRQ